MRECLMEPLKYYEKQGKDEHRANAERYFEELLKRSGVNVEQNRATVKRYREKLLQIEEESGRLSRWKGLRVLLIVLAVAGGISAVCGFWQSIYWLIPIGILALVGALILIFKVVNAKIKNGNRVLESERAKANAIRAEAEEQMAPLNGLFDEGDTIKLIEQTLPEVKFAKAYSIEQEAFFKKHHDFCDAIDPNESVTDTLSGELCGNPFLFYRYRSCDMGTATYSGSITIHWTETYRDSKGNLRTRHRSQVLTATVEKPKPYYTTHTALGYGCAAAPELSFTRHGSHSEELGERALERKIRRGAKKLRKKSREALEEGGSFREMANSEFEVLFGAHDRDHEVQFRVMYTPLAQQNTVDLLTSTSGYGDDFSFIKQDRYNVILSEHAAKWSMESSPSRYCSYDVDAARANFVSFNEEYFKSVFFDFAPLMAVPAYMSEPVRSMEPLPDYEANFTYYEHEVLSNAIGYDAFAHRGSATEAILKTSLVSREGEEDRVRVTAHSYRTESRVDMVSRLGGDGRMHMVPVHWPAYLPVEKSTDISVRRIDKSAREFRESDESKKGISSRYAVAHGLMAYIHT